VQTQYLSPNEAGAISKRLGKLLQTGAITHREYALGQCLLWRCRGSGQALARASYAALARVTHQAKDTVRIGLWKLEELGLIQRLKYRVRVRWLGRSVASRQGVNAYRLQAPSTDTDRRPVIREIEIQKEPQEVKEARAAQHALARVRQMMEARLAGRG
jgi:hypothetical protein